ncbi:MAG: DUF3667 domain-containing protein [Pseudomonadota bacterium]
MIDAAFFARGPRCFWTPLVLSAFLGHYIDSQQTGAAAKMTAQEIRRVGDAPEQGSPSHATCLACDAVLVGPYCHVCGQRDDDCRRSIFSLAVEVVRDTAALDGRFVRTCRESLTKPGQHLQRYAHGVRSPFTPPVRFFFVVLFVFFATLWVMDRNILVLQLIPEYDQTEEDSGSILGVSAEVEIGEEDVVDDVLASVLESLPEEVQEALDDADTLEDLPEDVRDALGEDSLAALEQVFAREEGAPKIVPYGGFFLEARDLTYTDEEKEWVRSQVGFDGEISLFNRNLSGERLTEAILFTMQNPAAFNNALNEAVPVLLLLFVPLMAILGAVFIRGRDALIYDHLLLSIQTHAFAIVLLIISLVTSGLGGFGGLLFLLGVPIYYFISARGAFGRSKRKTIAMTIFVGMIYNLFFTIGLVIAAAAAFLEIS